MQLKVVSVCIRAVVISDCSVFSPRFVKCIETQDKIKITHLSSQVTQPSSLECSVSFNLIGFKTGGFALEVIANGLLCSTNQAVRYDRVVLFLLHPPIH